MIFKWILALTVTIALTGCAFQRKQTGEFEVDGHTFRYELKNTETANIFPTGNSDDFVYTIFFPDGTTATTDAKSNYEAADRERDRLAGEWLDGNVKEPGPSDTVAGPPEDPANVPTVGLPETRDSN